MTPFADAEAAYEKARAVILPVPYDLSLSFRPGARLGPGAILAASVEVELYDDELGLTPAEIGIHTAAAVPWVAGDAIASHDRIRQTAGQHLTAGKWILALGGDHSITWPLVEAHREHHREFAVLHIDAHTDLYPEWQGSDRSHATVIYQLHRAGVKVVSVGQRAIAAEDRALIDREKIEVFPMHAIHDQAGWMERVIAALGPRVYVTFDFDVLDPSIMPATGTPLPGGFDWWTATRFLAKVFAAREVVGMDLVELSPVPGHFPAEMLAAQLAYRALGLKLRGRRSRRAPRTAREPKEPGRSARRSNRKR